MVWSLLLLISLLSITCRRHTLATWTSRTSAMRNSLYFTQTLGIGIISISSFYPKKLLCVGSSAIVLRDCLGLFTGMLLALRYFDKQSAWYLEFILKRESNVIRFKITSSFLSLAAFYTFSLRDSGFMSTRENLRSVLFVSIIWWIMKQRMFQSNSGIVERDTRVVGGGVSPLFKLEDSSLCFFPMSIFFCWCTDSATSTICVRKNLIPFLDCLNYCSCNIIVSCFAHSNQCNYALFCYIRHLLSG